MLRTAESFKPKAIDSLDDRVVCTDEQKVSYALAVCDVDHIEALTKGAL